MQQNKKSFLHLGKCPYCKSKVPYMRAFLERDNGEYVCEECGNTSTIYFIKKMNVVITAVTVTAILIFILYYIFGSSASLWGVILESLPFIIFFLMTPLFFRLVPLNAENKRPTEKRNTSNEIYSVSKANIRSGSQAGRHREGYSGARERTERNQSRYGASGGRYGTGSSRPRQSGGSGGRYSDRGGKRYY